MSTNIQPDGAMTLVEFVERTMKALYLGKKVKADHCDVVFVVKHVHVSNGEDGLELSLESDPIENCTWGAKYWSCWMFGEDVMPKVIEENRSDNNESKKMSEVQN